MTVRKLARETGLPVAQLFAHLEEVGCVGYGENDVVTGQQQLLLLRRLQSTRGSQSHAQVALADLEAAKTLEQMNGLLTQAMASQQLKPLIRADGLSKVVDKVLHLNGQSGQELLAAATLSRLAAVAGDERGDRVLLRAADVLTHEPGPIEDMDGDGRAKSYAAKVLSRVEAPWIDGYLAREAIAIDTADIARRELLEAALRRRQTLSAWTSSIAGQTLALREVPVRSRPRRVRRLIDVMDKVARAWRGEVGEDVGDGLAKCLRGLMTLDGLEADEAPLFEALDSLFSILVRSIELRFSIAFRAETYEPVNQGKRTLGVGRWGRFLRSSRVLPDLRVTLLESALVLARQGRTDGQLAVVLVASYPSRPQASAAIKRRFKTARDLDPGTADWWTGLGKAAGLSTPGVQRFGTTEDSQIGALLIGVDENRGAMEKIGRAVVPLLEISDEVLASTVRRAANGYRDIDQTARRLARMRRLTKTDLVGEDMEYNPLEHELVGGHRPGVRRVRVVRDGIRKDFGGQVKTLVKPWVEPEEGG